jgi:peptide deformylase
MTIVLASEQMRALGIVQEGDPILRQPATPFHLPEEADVARALVERLFVYLDRVAAVHVFSKGMGLAAPQIGSSRAAAVVRPATGTIESIIPIIFLNPRIVGQSTDTDEQYEGCLSFFDVRGVVPRPLRIDVEHSTLSGDRLITIFERDHARLVAHEIDHLHGQLYTDRMRPDVHPIPVEDYKGSGSAWSY